MDPVIQTLFYTCYLHLIKTIDNPIEHYYGNDFSMKASCVCFVNDKQPFRAKSMCELVIGTPKILISILLVHRMAEESI